MSGEGRVGTLFAGRYEIESRAGHGGMGTVYRAWDRRLSRWVAIKFPLTELADDPVFRRRFLREALMAATIEHRNIVPIYDAGDEEGVLYLTMRWVDGTDLNRLLRETGSLDPERALSIIAQVGSALDAAQARSLTHRDVKPANILLIPRASAEDLDQVYLADFGLTKRSSSQTVVTSPGYVIGSLHYLAPEQIEGSEVDGRTDLYSLGCVLYQCLTGLPPFERASDIAVIWAHVNASPPAVTARRPDLPAEIDAVIAKALAKSKDDRYPRCSEMVAAARLALGSAPAGGRTTSGPTAAAPPRPATAGAPATGAPPPPSAASRPAAPPPSGERPPAPTSTPAPAASAPPKVAEAGRKQEGGAAAPVTPPSVPANGRGARIAAAVVSIGVLLGIVVGGAFLVSRVMAPSSPPNGAVGPGPPQHRVTFDFTGRAQAWTVPAGVTSATFHVYGAQGGGTSAPSSGGLGGSAFATLKVNPGDTLVITVGGQGGSVAVCDQNTPAGAGGLNGGGAGGGGPCAGAGGGGASDVRTGPDPDQRILVAGGGGGATFTTGGDGGAGGDISGGSGRSGAGRTAAGGAPGTQATGSGSGQLGAGSAGVKGDTTAPVGHHGGGGGGGGYLGGAGGGQDTGGGGGSGKGPSGTTFDIGVREGHGMVEISY